MLDQAPASAAAGKGRLLSEYYFAAWRQLGRLASAWRGRRLVMDMRDFDDAQLADIGLKRSDVHRALQLPASADPSMYLVRARENPLGSPKRQ
jgi:uncharacterized protein YjiS (DUF1127 family)